MMKNTFAIFIISLGLFGIVSTVKAETSREGAKSGKSISDRVTGKRNGSSTKTPAVCGLFYPET